MSFLKTISDLYGEDCAQKCRLLDKTRQKCQILYCNLVFLKTCRDNNMLPKFTRMKRTIFIKKAESTYKQASLSLLHERIAYTRKEWSYKTETMRTIKWDLKTILDPRTWTKLDTMTKDQAKRIKQQKLEKHDKKYQALTLEAGSWKATPTASNTKVLHNLTNKGIPEAALKALQKWLNFAITPTRIPKEDIIMGIEATIKSLPEAEAEEIKTTNSTNTKQRQTTKSQHDSGRVVST